MKRRARRLKGPTHEAAPRLTGGGSSRDPIESLKIAVGSITRQNLSSGAAVATLICGDEGYPRMLAAIDVRDWNTAAAQSHREGIGEARNQETAALFQSASAARTP